MKISNTNKIVHSLLNSKTCFLSEARYFPMSLCRSCLYNADKSYAKTLDTFYSFPSILCMISKMCLQYKQMSDSILVQLHAVDSIVIFNSIRARNNQLINI